MEWKMNPNAVNQFPKGSIIYTEGEPVDSVGMIIKGRVMLHNQGARIILGSGSFLGIHDLYKGKHQSTYTAIDDLILFAYPISRVEELDTILSVNKDYHGFMVASYYKIIYELDQIYHGLLRGSSALYNFLKEYEQKYLNLAARQGIRDKAVERIAGLKMRDSDMELLPDRIQYYIECRNLPLDAVKTFYSYGNLVTLYQVEDQVNIVNQQIELLGEMAQDYVAMAYCLIDETDTCLFRLVAELSISMDNRNGTSNEIMEMMDSIIEQVNQAETLVERMLGIQFNVNRKRMEEIYHLLLSSNQEERVDSELLLKYSQEDTANALEEMKDSFSKILAYGRLQGEKAEEMQAAMQDFVYMKDKFSTEDTARRLRRKLAEHHYEIYLPVFIRAYKEKKIPRIIDMFLRYGFADERLLTQDQLLALYFLKEEEREAKICKIYDIKEWLTLIYEGKKEPSKNEFDMEYPEYLAGLRKQNRLKEADMAKELTSNAGKLHYEIQNMFRCNNRITNGQISSFVPFLHKDQWSNTVEKLLVKTEKVTETLASILRIDYSVFDREVIYFSQEKNITKEYVIRRIFPDIILMPTVGTNGIMWQEISGKRRDTPGRFLLPIFSDMNLGVLLIRILGRFRWELCRTIEGIAWNDIQNRSLTSEYSDYLQFYRKNRELSEEKKEKIKNQIQKGRNNSREIFVMDYEQWIGYESTGAIKLNKPVREIMATYCPFSKEIREQIRQQPLFEEAMARYNREKQRKVREIEGRHRLLQKENIEIPKELVDTLNYYRDL
ncbi:hypothetical protein HNQ56_002838 [Anaerotaenia torta]|uniref:cyclic nucleotide-binding domain-containing protein n=1 Tax=Anaerotaenia torta TaxID=433293 RepID=UPI003D1DDB5F